MEPIDSDDSESASDSPDPKKKDEYGLTKSFRRKLQKKYQILKIVGKGSYGNVAKARCLKSGKLVALKIMKNQTKNEYDLIKLLREIQLLRRLNEIY